jgi:hypothetical protein
MTPNSTNKDAIALPAGLEAPRPSSGTSNDKEFISLSVANSAWLNLLRWTISFPALLGTMLVGAVFIELRGFRVDPDLWWHIRIGQDILHTRHWPTTDSYSFTVFGTPWLAYEWLGDVTIAFVARFGFMALAALLFVLGAAITIGLFYYASLCAKNSKAGFASTTILSIFALGNFTLRPQMFGFLFLIITLIVLEWFRLGRTKALWILPPLFLLWVNAHGSWIIGIGVILLTIAGGLFSFELGSIQGVRWSDNQRIHLELALLGSLAMIPLTPYGTRLCTYPFLIASSIPLALTSVSEWLPMPLNTAWGQAFLLLLVACFLLQAAFHFKFRVQQLALGIGGAVMACLHMRFVLLFVPFFVPILSTMLACWVQPYHREKDKFVLNFVLMAATVLAMVRYFPSTSQLQHSVEAQFPVRAVNFLRNRQVTGPIFNNFAYGGYLMANLPEQKVFIDGREDPYEFEGVMADFLQVSNLRPAAFSVLKFYGIQICILERGEPLAVVLAQLPDWERIYYDDSTVIFERRDSHTLTATPAIPSPSSQLR